MTDLCRPLHLEYGFASGFPICPISNSVHRQKQLGRAMWLGSIEHKSVNRQQELENQVTAKFNIDGSPSIVSSSISVERSGAG